MRSIPTPPVAAAESDSKQRGSQAGRRGRIGFATFAGAPGMPNPRQPMPVGRIDCIRTPPARHGCAVRSMKVLTQEWIGREKAQNAQKGFR
jgi:hypothetical protein